MNTMLALAVAGTKRDKMNHKFPVSTTRICCLLFLNFVTESQQTDHSPADAVPQRASVATPQFLAQHVSSTLLNLENQILEMH